MRCLRFYRGYYLFYASVSFAVTMIILSEGTFFRFPAQTTCLVRPQVLRSLRLSEREYVGAFPTRTTYLMHSQVLWSPRSFLARICLRYSAFPPSWYVLEFHGRFPFHTKRMLVVVSHALLVWYIRDSCSSHRFLAESMLGLSPLVFHVSCIRDLLCHQGFSELAPVCEFPLVLVTLCIGDIRGHDGLFVRNYCLSVHP